MKYKIVQTDASQTGWGGILLAVTNIGEEKICRYLVELLMIIKRTLVLQT